MKLQRYYVTDKGGLKLLASRAPHRWVDSPVQQPAEAILLRNPTPGRLAVVHLQAHTKLAAGLLYSSRGCRRMESGRMSRTVWNTWVAVLLIAVLGATCVFACVGSDQSSDLRSSDDKATSSDPHACCHRNKHQSDSSGPSTPSEPGKDCQNSTLEVAKNILQLAPPALTSASAFAVFVPSSFPSARQADSPVYSPPDLLALHHILLI